MQNNNAPSRRVGLAVTTSAGHDRGILTGIAAYARTQNHWWLDINEFWLQNPEHMRHFTGDGVIAHVGTNTMQKILSELKIPTICVSESREDPGVPVVWSDAKRIGELAAEHFLERGFHHFAYLGMAKRYFSEQRGKAFERVINDAGYKCTWGPPEFEQFQLTHAPAGLDNWLIHLPKPVAIFACIDQMARHVVDVCRAQRIAVPEKVAVVGVDDDELVCELAGVPLSSVAVPTEKKGYEAARLLDQLMNGQEIPNRTIIEPSRVVVRRSSDVMALSDAVVTQAVRFIADHADEPLLVDDVADAVMISRRSLERRFRKSLGRSPAEEVRRVHLGRARALLEETDMPMPRIAAASGFADAAQLSKAFRRHLGMTPSECRQRVRFD